MTSPTPDGSLPVGKEEAFARAWVEVRRKQGYTFGWDTLSPKQQREYITAARKAFAAIATTPPADGAPLGEGE